MNQTLECRLEALGRQAVREAAAPPPPALLAAVVQRKSERSSLRLTVAAAGFACLLLTGAAAYLLLPSTPAPGSPAKSTPVATQPSPAAPELERSPDPQSGVALTGGAPASPGTKPADSSTSGDGPVGPVYAGDGKDKRPER